MPDQSKHTPAFKIFNYHYECSIPQHHLYCQEYIEQFGIPTSGNKEMDRVFANTMTSARLTIAEMAVVHENGGEIQVYERAKLVEIYEIIVEHLRQWQLQVSASPHPIDAPVDELRMLDNLAMEFYKTAKYHIKGAYKGNQIFHMPSGGGIMNPITRNVPENVPVEDLANKTHKPIADAIAKDLFSKSQRWR